jgi:hypothetical protein
MFVGTELLGSVLSILVGNMKFYHEIISDQASVREMIQFMPADSFPVSVLIWEKLYQGIVQVHSS